MKHRNLITSTLALILMAGCTDATGGTGVEPISGGFGAFAQLCCRLPLLWWLVPLVCLPGAGWVGSRIYRWVSTHRYLLHRNPVCNTNQCALPGRGNAPSSSGNGSGNGSSKI